MGTGTPQQVCNQCPAGKFKSRVGTALCTACPFNSNTWVVGSTNPVTGVSSKTIGNNHANDCICNVGFYGVITGTDATTDTCTPCGVDTFNAVVGQASCKSCPANSHTWTNRLGESLSNDQKSIANNHASDCLCDLAWERSISGTESASGSCTVCPAGKFKSLIGPEPCTSCPANSDTFTVADGSDTSGVVSDGRFLASHCSCKIGYWGTIIGTVNATGECKTCPHGKFKGNNGITECKSGPAGSDTWDIATAAGTALGPLRQARGGKVDPGSHVSADGTDPFMPRGIVSSQSDLTFAASQCLCNAGWEGEVTGDTSVTTSSCTPCAAGKYKFHVGTDLCIQCPTEASTPEGATRASDCECDVGHHGQVVGTVDHRNAYLEDGNANNGCLACPEGTYKDVIGTSQCKVCPNMAWSMAGASSCGTGDHPVYFCRDGTCFNDNWIDSLGQSRSDNGIYDHGH